MNPRSTVLIWALILCVVLFGEAGLAKPAANKILLPNGLTQRIDGVLQSADEYRKALADRNDALSITRMQELNRAISKAMDGVSEDPNNGKHIELLLKEARKSLDMSFRSSGDEKKSALQNTFRQIVILGRNYKTNEKYKFFFCKNDSSMWLQKEGKPQNPITPEAKNCVEVQ